MAKKMSRRRHEEVTALPDRAVLTTQLLDLWREIEPFAKGEPDRLEPLTAAQRLVVHRWKDLFEPELFIAETARKAMVRSTHNLSLDQLREAVGLVDRLRVLLYSKLREPLPTA